MSEGKCLLISGLSGAGKTTVGKLLKGWIFIDGDDFFASCKPNARLSSGEYVSNWDHPSAIDWEALNLTVKRKLAIGKVVLVTFLPMLERYCFRVDYHVRLLLGDNYIEKCIAARIVSKNLVTPEKRARDAMVVRELVVPLYREISQRKADLCLDVYLDSGKSTVRRKPEDIAAEIFGACC